MQDNMGRFTGILSGSLKKLCTWRDVANDPGVEVTDFTELTEHVAKLTFHNPGLNLFFRGQTENFTVKCGVNGPKTEVRTSLLPAANREPISPTLVQSRQHFKWLDTVTDEAKHRLAHLRHEQDELDQFKHVTWAVLQHYGCETPLLDITQSLHVACCFAVFDYEKNRNSKEGYIYVLGLPNINGNFSYFAHEGMVMVKLQAACPPQAKRPHYQQGFLVGSMPSNPKAYWYRYRNLVLRLIAKFRICNSALFWTPGYSLLPRDTMMPNDEVADVVEEIKMKHKRGK